jgi:putative phosphoribosyl transferase
MNGTMFRDRAEAGRQLAEKLGHLKDKRPIVLALPRGGVPVGLEIALTLDAPLDLMLVRKVGAPHQPELAIGAVVDGHHPERFINRDLVERLGLPASYIEEASQRELQEIERRRELYARGRSPVEVRDRTAIVVDDGIATGATVRVALRALREAGAARVVLAVPVAPAGTADDLRSECDEAVFIATPEIFGAVGFYYDDFEQLRDAEVIEMLDRALERSR